MQKMDIWESDMIPRECVMKRDKIIYCIRNDIFEDELFTINKFSRNNGEYKNIRMSDSKNTERKCNKSALRI